MRALRVHALRAAYGRSCSCMAVHPSQGTHVPNMRDAGRTICSRLCYACRTTKKSKGIALIQFAEPAGALAAKEALDGAIFQGRLLHVLPAHRPPPPKQAPEQV